MARDGFVMYRSWWEAIRHLPREIQGEVLTAIVEYGLYGETTESLKPIAKAMLAMAKPQIDANQKRYENGVKGGEFGVLGGRPKKGQENPKETPPKPQGNPTETPKEKDKEKEKYKVSKENAYGVKETPESPAMPEGDSVDFEKNEIFQKECEAYALEAENLSKKENSGGAARKGAICGGFDAGTVKPPSEARKARSIEENVRICQESASWLEAVAMQNGMTVEGIKAELAKFPEHLTAYGNDEPKTLQDFKSHFNNYLKKKRNADDSTAAHGARKGAGAAAGGTLGGRAERPRPKSIF